MNTKSLAVSPIAGSRSHRRKFTEVAGLLVPRSLSDDDVRRMRRALEAEGVADVEVLCVDFEPSDMETLKALLEGSSGSIPRALTGDPPDRTLPPSVNLAHSLSAARARGAAVTQKLLADESMLNTSGLAQLLGMSEEGVRQKRKRHEILGLEFAKRGIRYPAWQVLPDRKLLPSLPRLFEILGDDPWRLFRFLTQVHGETGGKSALDALKRGKIEGVLAAAENTAMGAFS